MAWRTVEIFTTVTTVFAWIADKTKIVFAIILQMKVTESFDHKKIYCIHCYKLRSQTSLCHKEEEMHNTGLGAIKCFSCLTQPRMKY